MFSRGAILDRLYTYPALREVKDQIGRPIKRVLIGQHGLHLIIQELKAVRSDIHRVVDIGAATGDTARLFLSEFPSAHVDCFEPQSASYRMLVKRTKKTAERVRCHQKALSDTPGFATLHLCSYADASSLHPLTPMVLKEGKREIGTEIAEVTTLDVVYRHRADMIDLLKIDVEGAEQKVLLGGKQLIRTGVLNVVVEMQPLFWGRRSTRHIETFTMLHDWGFEFVGNYGDYWFSKDKAVLAAKFGG